MSPRELFLHTVDDLRARVLPTTGTYDVFMAAPLLRKLFFDGRPLVDLVRPSARASLRFHIGLSMYPPERGTTWYVGDGFDPQTGRFPEHSKNVGFDEFATAVVCSHEAEVFTVRDVVLQVANVLGAVHVGHARKEKEKILQSISSPLQIGGEETATRQLRPITRVALLALRRLESELR